MQVGFPVQTGEAGSRPDGASAEAGDSAVQPNDAAAQPNPLTGGATIPLSPTGRVVEASELPAGRVAVRSYIGGYDGLGNAWGQFMQDVAAQGEKPSRTFWEVYCTEPTPDGDPSQNRTDLMVLLDAAH